ncbi:MAG: tetratricopeptide repeat protein [Nitrospiraceae bacterium]
MNRADRRREDKLQRGGGRQAQTALAPLLQEGRTHHQAGRLSEAARLYETVLAQQPEHAEAAHLLGLVVYRLGRLDEACELIRRAICSDNSQSTYHFNLGVVSQRKGAVAEAEEAYREAISRFPRYVDALVNLGNLLRDQGRSEEAVESYRRALVANPAAVEAHNGLGVALKEQGLVHEAIEAYREALRLKPGHVEAQNNLGLALMESGRLDEAVAAFQRVVRTEPANPKGHYHLGLVYLWKGQIEASVASLRRSAEIKHDHGRPVAGGTISRARLKHEAEQVAYLMGEGRLGPDSRDYLDRLTRVRDKADMAAPQSTWVSLNEDDAAAIAPSLNRIVFPSQAESLAAGALNPQLDVPAIEAEYHRQKPEIMYVDHLLTPEALAGMQRFCLEATIWKKEYENGYLGAFIGDGLASPLLFQIAEELRLRFPAIFKDHRLTQAWSFKHDSARRGLGMHADAAAVNVNFWITPDEANLDPETGGLVVWDKEAPRDWNFKAYNSEKNRGMILDFLEKTGAKMVRIPYRCNRAVIFNSDLFHETDDVRFKDTYLTRRINITLLYGFRTEA